MSGFNPRLTKNKGMASVKSADRLPVRRGDVLIGFSTVLDDRSLYMFRMDDVARNLYPASGFQWKGSGDCQEMKNFPGGGGADVISTFITRHASLMMKRPEPKEFTGADRTGAYIMQTNPGGLPYIVSDCISGIFRRFLSQRAPHARISLHTIRHQPRRFSEILQEQNGGTDMADDIEVAGLSSSIKIGRRVLMDQLNHVSLSGICPGS